MAPAHRATPGEGCTNGTTPQGYTPLDITERGISLAQLRDLKEQVKCLCKAGLLIDPGDECNGHKSGSKPTGRVLAWPEVDMHHICKLIIKRKLDKHRCSWAEHVAKGAQKPKFFVTHNWSSPFRDFMNAIEIHAKEAAVRPRDTYWICAFALNQFDVELGDKLESSPFVQALQASTGGVLMLDKEAHTLQRIWCLLEIHVVLNKPELSSSLREYHILTPFGIIGSRALSSSPLLTVLLPPSAARHATVLLTCSALTQLLPHKCSCLTEPLHSTL